MQCSICSFKATSQWKKWKTSFLEKTVAIYMILLLHSPLNSSTVIARAEDAHVILQETAVFLEVYDLMISIKTERDCLMVRLTFASLFFLKTMKLRSQGPVAPVGGGEWKTWERGIHVKLQMIGSNLVEVLDFFRLLTQFHKLRSQLLRSFFIWLNDFLAQLITWIVVIVK